jgi:hypothetical protein
MEIKMKVAKGHKKQVVKLASLIGGYVKAPRMAASVMAWLAAQQSMEARVARLSKLVANDNYAPISCHLVSELADILAFTAAKRKVSHDVLMASLCIAFGVGSLRGLNDSQFRPALDYVLNYKSEMTA